MTEQWEYKYVHGLPNESALNQLGELGWELAAVINTVSGRTGQSGPTYGESGSIHTHVTLILKRHKRGVGWDDLPLRWEE